MGGRGGGVGGWLPKFLKKMKKKQKNEKKNKFFEKLLSTGKKRTKKKCPILRGRLRAFLNLRLGRIRVRSLRAVFYKRLAQIWTKCRSNGPFFSKCPFFRKMRRPMYFGKNFKKRGGGLTFVFFQSRLALKVTKLRAEENELKPSESGRV